MNSLFKKALQDLEFDKICYQVSVRCNTDKGKEVAYNLEVSSDFETIEESIQKVAAEMDQVVVAVEEGTTSYTFNGTSIAISKIKRSL